VITLIDIHTVLGLAATLLLRDSLTKKCIGTKDIMDFKETYYFKMNCHKKVRVARTPKENVYIVYL
jgi:hypothetical protein